jgi:hypothetical protein
MAQDGTSLGLFVCQPKDLGTTDRLFYDDENSDTDSDKVAVLLSRRVAVPTTKKFVKLTFMATGPLIKQTLCLN